MTVIGGEGNREDIVVVAHEAARGDTRSKLPQAKSLIPGGGEGVGTVGGDDLLPVNATSGQLGWRSLTQSETMCE